MKQLCHDSKKPRSTEVLLKIISDRDFHTYDDIVQKMSIRPASLNSIVHRLNSELKSHVVQRAFIKNNKKALMLRSLEEKF